MTVCNMLKTSTEKMISKGKHEINIYTEGKRKNVWVLCTRNVRCSRTNHLEMEEGKRREFSDKDTNCCSLVSSHNKNLVKYNNNITTDTPYEKCVV